jgi:ABC-type dipeptide/oligopeptide/nickel transport system permease subunit
MLTKEYCDTLVKETESLTTNTTKIETIENLDEFHVLEQELLPPVDEHKRFLKIFFHRKIVIVGFVILLVMIVFAIFAPLIAPFGYNEQDLNNVMQKPSKAHWLGTDQIGRDLLSRIIYGSQIAFIVGVVSVLISAAIGTALGMVAGFIGGFVNDLIMRITDAIMAIPGLVFTLLICAVLGNGLPGVVIAIGIGFFPGYIRLINGQVLSVKQNDYILAERAMGAKRVWIMIRHILPNVMSPLIVQMTMMMGSAIMMEAMLSFLGVGLIPPTPAWGSMCKNGYLYLMTNPLLSLAPGLAIMLLVFAMNMVGDGLRDALDPRMRGTETH